jgi:thiol-disulfide isomerase/thioredoxin
MMFVSLGIGTVIAVVLITIVSVLTGGRVQNGTPPPALVGTTLSSLSESSLAGPTIPAPWNSHHATAVIFFASWCGPCKTELPALAKYLASHSLGRVTVLGVDTQDARNAGRNVVTKDHLNFSVMFDPQSTVAAGAFKLGSLPDTVFVTPRGVVQHMTIGPITAKQFAAGVAALNA